MMETDRRNRMVTFYVGDTLLDKIDTLQERYPLVNRSALIRHLISLGMEKVEKDGLFQE